MVVAALMINSSHDDKAKNDALQFLGDAHDAALLMNITA
jgi:hypothetical protein